MQPLWMIHPRNLASLVTSILNLSSFTILPAYIHVSVTQDNYLQNWLFSYLVMHAVLNVIYSNWFLWKLGVFTIMWLAYIPNRSIFSAVSDVKLEKSRLSDSTSDLMDFRGGGRTPGISPGDRTRASSVMSPHLGSSATPTKIDKRLIQIHVSNQGMRLTWHLLRVDYSTLGFIWMLYVWDCNFGRLKYWKCLLKL